MNYQCYVRLNVPNIIKSRTKSIFLIVADCGGRKPYAQSLW